MSEQILKASADNFGFDPQWTADILEKYGPDVLALAVEAVRNGVSVQMVMETVQKFGPGLLQFIASLLTKQKMAMAHRVMMGANADVVPGPIVVDPTNPTIDPNIIDVLVEQYLPVILQKYLPILVEKYGPQIIQLILNSILKK